MRWLRFDRNGLAENPIGYRVAYTLFGSKEHEGEVTEVFHNELGSTILKVKYANGEEAPPILACLVKVVSE